MPLTVQDYLEHPEFGPMPQEMQAVAQQCCGLSKLACLGDRGVAGSNLKEKSLEYLMTKAELDQLAIALDPLGGSYS